ncbi:hypothetical protein [Halalkalibacterium halodurans]|jgi:hypothetical protein|uniref:Uncharacterized protein n=1 Tax=Halalkalibacterium halodurans TaxID=86665 RepID=A0A0M0KKF3_ALKHA|nr:hypothetical protein [Halalkalibacterium halodurans]TPE68684.1 hypothetical protein AMD02_012240 [Halalkalibacterium halodurans]
MNKVISYSAPDEAVGRDDFSIKVRPLNGPWQNLYVYKVPVEGDKLRIMGSCGASFDDRKTRGYHGGGDLIGKIHYENIDI